MYAVDSPTNRQKAGPGASPPMGSGRRRRRPQRPNTRTAWLLSLPVLIWLVAILGWPFIRMVVLSFQNMRLRDLINNRTPPWAGLDNYSTILSSPEFWAVTWHTIAFTVVAVVLSVVLGLCVALLMRRVAKWVRLLMIVAMMFVWSLPQLVAAQIFKWLVDADFGVVNYMLSLIPGVHYENHSWFVSPLQGWSVITTLVVWAGIPFLAITLNAGLTQVPKELIEAATVDGATPWQTLRGITLPILKPLLIIVTTLSVIWDFGLFTQNFVLRDGHPEPTFQTLATYSYTQAFAQAKYGLGAAVSVITVLLMLGVMAFYIRQMFKIGEAD